MNFIVFSLIAFVCVVVLIPLAIKFAPILKLVDAPDGPDGRKQHEGQIPLIGGLIIFPVFIGVAIAAGYSISDYWPLYGAIFMLLVTGAVDDKIHLHSMVKFFVQFCAAALIILPGGAQVFQLGDLFGLGHMGLDIMSLPFSFAAVVLLINAVNLMDGLDGLSAGYCAVAMSWLGLGFYHGGYQAEFLMVGLLVSCMVGFLVFNMRTPFRAKASLFLGDAGSLCLGVCLAWFALHAGKDYMNPAVEPIGVAWVLAIPIMDTCAQFYRRVRNGRHPFSPDRGHFHHHFVNAGVPDGWATATILALAFVTGAVGVFGMSLGVSPAIITISWMILLLWHIWYSAVPDRYIGVISRLVKT
ncbi:MAG: MraY family glycosyltransferase [Bdellovibrionales bacterium]